MPFKPYEDWKPGDDEAAKPSKPAQPAKFSDVPITEKDAAGLEILLIGGPLSGQTMRTRSLENWELIHCHASDTLVAYQQDKPGSHNYYFHRAKTAWLEEHRETIIGKIGHTFKRVHWVEKKP